MAYIPAIRTAKALAVTYNDGSGATAVSTTGKIKFVNVAGKDGTAASNLSGGVDRPMGVRDITGSYLYAWGDCPPMFPNDLFDLSFTMDGATAVQIAGAGNTGVRCRGIEVVVEPYDKKKKNLVYYIAHLAGAGDDVSATGTVPSDTTDPTLLSVKSLGVQLAYWNPTTHALVWSTVCYFAGMRLLIQALANPAWPSCLNGIAYTPAGNIDWRLELGECLDEWPIPRTPNSGLPYMLTSEPASTPGALNASGDLVYPDLDCVVGARMITRVNAALTPVAYWQLLYGTMSEKSGEFDHDSRDPMIVNFVFEKCGSMLSRTGDTGYDVGSIAYVNNGVTTTFWP